MGPPTRRLLRCRCAGLLGQIRCTNLNQTNELRDSLMSQSMPGQYQRCTNTTYVAMTPANSPAVPALLRQRPPQLLVTNFSSAQDLVEAVLTSTHLAWFSDGRAAYRCRGQLYSDGTLSGERPAASTRGTHLLLSAVGTAALLRR